ncbi:MAG: L-threonylcarbamoyladenylate synthase [Desulfobulbaceae bacterium]
MARYGVSGREIERAVSLLRAGGIVAFPTETYYGLGVDPLSEDGLVRLFQVKDRPALKPVLVLVADLEQVGLLAREISPTARTLMDRFWPGPLTLVLPARTELSPHLTGGTGTVGVRLSPHPVASELLRTFGGPLTATSANRSGHVPAVTAEEVRLAFGSEVDMILDGGRTPGEKGSTLVGVSGNRITCIREGCIPFAEVLQTAGGATG